VIYPFGEKYEERMYTLDKTRVGTASARVRFWGIVPIVIHVQSRSGATHTYTYGMDWCVGHSEAASIFKITEYTRLPQYPHLASTWYEDRTWDDLGNSYFRCVLRV